MARSMTPQKFDSMVTNLANQEVQARIKKFKEEVQKALNTLLPEIVGYGLSSCIISNQPPAFVEKSNPAYTSNKYYYELSNSVHNILKALHTGKNDVWPSLLWEKAETNIRERLLQQLDVVSQALVAPEPKEDDAKPADLTPMAESL